MTTKMSNVFKVVGLAAAVTFASGIGCGSTPRMGIYEVGVTPDGELSKTLAEAPLQVDLVGVSPSESATWDGIAAGDYFAATNTTLREDVAAYRVTYNFNANESGAKVLAKDNPIWKTWQSRGVTKMAVLSYSRAMQAPSSIDLRKKIIPLTTDSWNNGQRIDLVVSRSGVSVPTAMKPASK